MVRGAALAALVAATSAVLSGCGAVDHMSAAEGDASNGKTLFTEECASCHVLADADAAGKIGPSLDDAFESVRTQGFDESTIRDVVRGQIAYPEEPMPAQLVVGEDADDVAAYVAKCGGVPECGVQAAKPAPGGGAKPKPGGPPAKGGAQTEGKQVFTANCGACHTLADAGTSGQVGPNLDDVQPEKADAQEQVENGGGGMPAFEGQLSDAQIEAVAAYVADAAGK